MDEDKNAGKKAKVKLPKNRKEMYRLMAFNVKLANCLGAFPAHFDLDNLKLTVSTSILDRVKNIICIASWITFTIYFSTLLVIFTLEQEESLDYGICFLGAVVFMAGIPFHITMLIFLPKISALTTDVIAVLLEFQRDCYIGDIPDSKLLEVIILKLFRAASIVYPVFTAFFALIMQGSRVFPVNFLPTEYQHWSLVFLAIIIFWWQVASIWCIANFFMSQFLLMHQYLHIFGSEIRLGKSSYLTKDSVRSAPSLVRLHRMLTLQMNMITEMTRSVLQPIAFSINRAILVSNWMIIMFFETLSAISLSILCVFTSMAICGWLGLLILTYKLSKNHKSITKSLSLFKSEDRKECQYVEKYIKSCKPVLFRIGNYTIISKKSPPNFLLSMTRGTFKLVMAT